MSLAYPLFWCAVVPGALWVATESLKLALGFMIFAITVWVISANHEFPDIGIKIALASGIPMY